MRTIPRPLRCFARVGVLFHVIEPCEPTAFCRDISGDAVFVSQVREYRDKPWVNRTMVPYAPTPNGSHPHPHPDSPARSLPLNVALRVFLSCPIISNMSRPSRHSVQIKILDE